VQQPEQVVAITFTRKAAAEMRARVQRALRAATGGETGARPHEQATLRLAQTVVQRDSLLDWALLAQPQRLRIDTLDAFNVWLSQQLPVLSDGVAAAAIVDKADAYYAQAARRTIAAVMGDDPAFLDNLRTLLRNVDNDTERLERLLAALLPRRDQWLPRLAGRATAELRASSGALQRLVDEGLAGAALCRRAAPGARAVAAPRAGTANDSLRHAHKCRDRASAIRWTIALAAWRGVATAPDQRRRWRKRCQAGRVRLTRRFATAAVRCSIGCDEEPLRALWGPLQRCRRRCSEQQWRASLHSSGARPFGSRAQVNSSNTLRRFVRAALAAQRALGQVDALSYCWHRSPHSAPARR
jgi:hypothetical protein